MFTTHDLTLYLEHITQQLKDNELSEEIKQELSVLYMKQKYKEDYYKKEKKVKHDEDMNLRYISLGWYIYHFLLKK